MGEVLDHWWMNLEKIRYNAPSKDIDVSLMERMWMVLENVPNERSKIVVRVILL